MLYYAEEVDEIFVNVVDDFDVARRLAEQYPRGSSERFHITGVRR
jgi:hypothetical protein